MRRRGARVPVYDPLRDVAFREKLRLLAGAASGVGQNLSDSRDPALQRYAAELLAAAAYANAVLTTGAPPSEALEREAA